MPRRNREVAKPDFDFDDELDAIADEELEGEVIDEIEGSIGSNIGRNAGKENPEKINNQGGPEVIPDSKAPNLGKPEAEQEKSGPEKPEPEKPEPEKPEPEKPEPEKTEPEKPEPVREEEKPVIQDEPKKEPEKEPEKQEPEQEKEAEQKEPEQKELEQKEPELDLKLEPENEEEPFSFGDEDEIEDRPEDDLQQKLEDIKERRRQLEQEEEEYRRNKDIQNQADMNKKLEPKPDEPEKEAGKDGKKPEAAKKQEKKVIVNPFKGTVNAQGEINEALMEKQWKEVRSLRYMLKAVTEGDKRPEFNLVKKQLYNLDTFLRQTAGRKKLSKKEMETYELLTMKAYKATAFYDKALEKEEAQLKERGKQLSKKDIKRLNAMDRVRESVFQMRSDMYEKEMQRKKEEMQKKCEEKIQSMKETLDGLTHAGYKDDKLKEVLTGAVVRTLFFMNRMDSVERSIRLQPGESVKRSTKRLTRDLRPSKQDMDRTAKMELTKNIVDEGMKEIKAGKVFSTDDVARLQQEYIRKNAKKLAATRKRRKNLQNIKDRKSIHLPDSSMKK